MGVQSSGGMQTTFSAAVVWLTLSRLSTGVRRPLKARRDILQRSALAATFANIADVEPVGPASERAARLLSQNFSKRLVRHICQVRPE